MCNKCLITDVSVDTDASRVDPPVSQLMIKFSRTLGYSHREVEDIQKHDGGSFSSNYLFLPLNLTDIVFKLVKFFCHKCVGPQCKN